MSELHIEPARGAMGAVVRGVGCAAPVNDDIRLALIAALHEHRILVFPGQRLSPRAQREFTEVIGPLEGHINREFQGEAVPEVHVLSNLDEHGEPRAPQRPTGTESWHTDKSYTATPSFATLLHALEVPARGGETEFADMVGAFEALPVAQRSRLADLRVVHSWEHSRLKAGARPASAQEVADAPPVCHPLVRTHPATGRPALYIGNHASHVESMSIEDGRALLAELLEFATAPRFVTAHRWQRGDLVMWDNPSLLHRGAPFDHSNDKRVLHRTVVRGGPTA